MEQRNPPVRPPRAVREEQTVPSYEGLTPEQVERLEAAVGNVFGKFNEEMAVGRLRMDIFAHDLPALLEEIESRRTDDSAPRQGSDTW